MHAFFVAKEMEENETQRKQNFKITFNQSYILPKILFIFSFLISIIFLVFRTFWSDFSLPIVCCQKQSALWCKDRLKVIPSSNELYFSEVPFFYLVFVTF